MGRFYSIAFDGQSITNANGDYDFWELTPADDKPIKLIALDLGFSTLEGDANEDLVRIGVVRGNATSGNGSSATPRPLNPADAAASFTAETIASTPASTGTPLTLWATTFNARSGIQKIWLPEERPMASQADTLLCVRLFAAVDADNACSGTLVVEEC